MLRSRIINALHQKGLSGEQKDGMDISLCSINLNNNTLQFSGANNPAYILTNRNLPVPHNVKIHQFDTNVLYELKPDKMPVAIYVRMDSFTKIDFDLRKGDKIYLFSDGYPDQFGGLQGRKFKYAPFMKVITENSDKPMEEQKNLLSKTFEDWMNPEININHEQIDDVTVIGMEI
jgi:serine phosphatase RsbU (regulator of sigma subunit)